MTDFGQRLNDLRIQIVREERKFEELRSSANTMFSPEARQRHLQNIEQEIKTATAEVEKTIDDILRYPRQHTRHFHLLDKFWQTATYEKSVFIMTKFPEAMTPLDAQLKNVIDTVAAELSSLGFVPRIASEKDFHDLLWDNVELHLLGCARGVAIVEDKYKPELNPNVSMEWGWMRGMGKPVLFLVEESFDNLRADWSGLRREVFKWANPQPQIATALQKWLRP